jgi:hypothetical protein
MTVGASGAAPAHDPTRAAWRVAVSLGWVQTFVQDAGGRPASADEHR